MQTSVGLLAVNAAKHYGEKTAVIFESTAWSFSEIHRLSDQLSRQLRHLGVRQGQVVSIYSPNCPEWIISYYAILKAGAVVNPLNLMLTASEAAYALEDCGSVAVLGAADKLANLKPFLSDTTSQIHVSFTPSKDPQLHDFWDLVERALPIGELAVEIAISPEDVSTIAYTSGTTGHPKGAVLSHKSILMNTAMTATMHMRSASDVVVSALPLSHVYGNIVMNAAIAYGMTLVLHKSFEPTEILTSIERYRATIFEGVPTMYAYLLDHPELSKFDLSSLTRCTVGGQAMPEARMRRVEERFGCRLLELWGMTEIGGLGATHSLYGPLRHGSIGTALPHMQLRVTDVGNSDLVVPVGEIGELQVKGPIVMSHYLGKSEASEEVLVADGWLRTGDLARIDAEGFVYVVDRMKDMIITAGFNIYPAELERVISEHPCVSMVAVGGVKDDLKGELAKAYIVKKANAEIDVDELVAFCRARLAAYKVPRSFQFVSDLPKTSSGKIMRRKLSEL